MTKKEFTNRYIKRSKLKKLPKDLIAIPCVCGETDCAGWQIVTREACDKMIEEYIYAGKSHRRKKRDVCKKFNINKSTFVEVLNRLTYKYLIYEAGHGAVGILSTEEL